MEDRMGLEPLKSRKNPFRNHWSLFLDEKITLLQLELICFAWIVQHENLYKEKPLPTEPMQYPGTTEVDFIEVKKAWHLGCRSREVENKSNVWWLGRAKRFFLNSKNNYEEGIELFDKYKERDVALIEEER